MAARPPLFGRTVTGGLVTWEPMDTPNPDTLKHIVDRLKANDIAWFKDRFKAGDFAWLKDRLPEGGYTKLGEKIEAGDLAYVRTIFGGLDVPGFANLSGAKAALANCRKADLPPSGMRHDEMLKA